MQSSHCNTPQHTATPHTIPQGICATCIYVYMYLYLRRMHICIYIFAPNAYVHTYLRQVHICIYIAPHAYMYICTGICVECIYVYTYLKNCVNLHIFDRDLSKMNTMSRLLKMKGLFCRISSVL